MAPASVRHFVAPGTADVTTGLKAITTINLKATTAGTGKIRLTSVTGDIIIPVTLALNGELHVSFASPLVCSDGNFFWDSDGTIVCEGAVSGW